MIAIVLGTRPEIIKMSPIIRICEKQNIDYFILHTGQHYSYEMDKVFFTELELPEADSNLDVGSGTHASQTAKMMIGIEKILVERNPNVILIEGDTNTVLAGALTASKLGIKIGHIEAGLRSFDRNMPEEINRIITDHISDFLFCPTEMTKFNLIKESIPESKIFITGNTIVDAIYQNLELAKKKSDILKENNLNKKDYFLITSHRQENVDVKQRLSGILKALKIIRKEYGIPIFFPIHPRTLKRINEFNLDVGDITLIKPLSYLDFLMLEANSKLILTDSGGIQEESCILNVPCVTLRENTERPETLLIGSNKLVGTNPDKIIAGIREMLGRNLNWKNPFGDGNSSEKILKIIKEKQD